jgi:hypothetical protein
MSIMSEEIDRLDKDNNGELDPNELMQSPISIRHLRASEPGEIAPGLRLRCEPRHVQHGKDARGETADDVVPNSIPID